MLQYYKGTKKITLLGFQIQCPKLMGISHFHAKSHLVYKGIRTGNDNKKGKLFAIW